MGQYYVIAFQHEGDDAVTVNDRRIEGEGYIPAKLMEHSWLGTSITDAVANEMHNRRMRLAWIGDYADKPDEVKKATRGAITYDEVWGRDRSSKFPKAGFSYAGKWLCNHDKRVCISFDKYIKDSKDAGIEWEINPIPLLTAIGNGRGGGDYHGLNEDKVGIWAWDTLEISEKEPVGYMRATVLFNESV